MTYKLFEIIKKKLLSILENKYIYLGSEEKLKSVFLNKKKWIEKE